MSVVCYHLYKKEGNGIYNVYCLKHIYTQKKIRKKKVNKK